MSISADDMRVLLLDWQKRAELIEKFVRVHPQDWLKPLARLRREIEDWSPDAYIGEKVTSAHESAKRFVKAELHSAEWKHHHHYVLLHLSNLRSAIRTVLDPPFPLASGMSRTYSDLLGRKRRTRPKVLNRARRR